MSDEHPFSIVQGGQRSPNPSEPRRDPERLRAALLQLQEDYERLRAQRDTAVSRARDQARAELLGELIEVRDDVERAVAALPDRDEPWQQGVVSIDHSMAALLQRHGIQRIDRAGVRFDPARHEAVGTIRSESIPEGMVVEVTRPGYVRADGTLVRAAHVVVST